MRSDVTPSTDRSDAAAPDFDVYSLTRRMVKGDERAYRQFHAAYFDRLARYLLVVHRGDEHAMRDALAETFRRVVKHIRSFEDDAVFWSWLTVLARSAAHDQRRSVRRYRSFLDRFRQQVPPVADAANDNIDLAGQLRQAVEQLTADDKALIELKYYERHPVRAIAARLATTEASVESRLVRIRRKLKDALLPPTP